MLADLKRTDVQLRWTAVAALAAAFMMAAVDSAAAVSLRTKMACSSDYYAHCSQFPSESAETRACMRAVGERLSPRCVNALVAEGEVSAGEVKRRAAHLKKQ